MRLTRSIQSRNMQKTIYTFNPNIGSQSLPQGTKRTSNNNLIDINFDVDTGNNLNGIFSNT